MCPTSEFPIWSRGSPTHFSEASMVVWGQVCRRKFQCGLRAACLMAILDQSDRPNFLRASVLLIGLAWTLPFLQPWHRYPLTGFYSEWLAFALGLAAALPLLRRAPWRDATVPMIALAPLGL